LLIFADDPAPLRLLFGQQRTGETLPVLGVETARSLDPLDHLPGDDRQSDDLRMRVLLRSAGVGPVILEHDHMGDARVGRERAKPLDPGPEQLLEMPRRKQGRRQVMGRVLDDDLVQAHPVHTCVHLARPRR